MKRVYIIFFSIYGIYHLGLVGFTFYATSVKEKSDFKMMLELSEQIPMTRWLALFGFLLLLITVGIFLKKESNHRKQLEKIEAEKNSYKAKMYDMMDTDSPAAESESIEAELEPEGNEKEEEEKKP